MSELASTLVQLAKQARGASRAVARADKETRTRAILTMHAALQQQTDAVLAANALDLEAARARNISPALLDRLTLTTARLEALATAVLQIAHQEDPVGEIATSWQRPNGLLVQKVRLPLGVILMVYEARPNVTLDAAALCVRSGNAAILRGGSEATHTNQALERVVHQGLHTAGMPTEAVQLVPTQDREAIDILLTLEDSIDLVIPRGGEGLIRRVVAKSRIPVIKHYQGICHVYVHADADLSMASRIAINAKVQRPGVCNAMETLLVDRAVAETFLPDVLQSLRDHGVEIRGCAATRALAPWTCEATEQDWHTEFLDLILAVRVVDGLEQAIEHIDNYGSHHTASIVSHRPAAQEQFVRQVDASCVLVNASTRFNDGGELGLGAEMGISTTKLHAYGPMGAGELTTQKFVVRGSGQIRE